jgi:hypothetical protein
LNFQQVLHYSQSNVVGIVQTNHVKTEVDPSFVAIYKRTPVIVSILFNNAVSNSVSMVANGVLLIIKNWALPLPVTRYQPGICLEGFSNILRNLS